MFFFPCVPAVFPVWRGIGVGNGVGGGWSQGLGRCLRWETDGSGQKPRIPIFDYPVWLVRCQGGRARLIEVCQRGRGAIRLPTDMLSIKLPQLYDIHQVPKVKDEAVLYGVTDICRRWLINSFIMSETPDQLTHFSFFASRLQWLNRTTVKTSSTHFSPICHAKRSA